MPQEDYAKKQVLEYKLAEYDPASQRHVGGSARDVRVTALPAGISISLLGNVHDAADHWNKPYVVVKALTNGGWRITFRTEVEQAMATSIEIMPGQKPVVDVDLTQVDLSGLPDPENFDDTPVCITYEGTTIYHTFNENDPKLGLSDYWYSLKKNSGWGEAFDVRELPGWKHFGTWRHEEAVQETMMDAIAHNDIDGL